MAPKSSFVLGGLAIAAATICALPAARGTDVSTDLSVESIEQAPVVVVNREAKGNRIDSESRMTVPMSINRKNVPAQPAPVLRSEEEGAELLDGCEPAFSPVTMPTMAHYAGRCIG